MNSSRELGDKVVRGLAKAGLVWAVAVLAVVFMAMSAEGQYGDSARAAGSGEARAAAHSTAQAAARPGAPAEGPRAAGVALALLFLGVGGTVLGIGAARDNREVRRRYALQSNPAEQLPMAFGLSQLG